MQRNIRKHSNNSNDEVSNYRKNLFTNLNIHVVQHIRAGGGIDIVMDIYDVLSNYDKTYLQTTCSFTITPVHHLKILLHKNILINTSVNKFITNDYAKKVGNYIDIIPLEK